MENNVSIFKGWSVQVFSNFLENTGYSNFLFLYKLNFLIFLGKLLYSRSFVLHKFQTKPTMSNQSNRLLILNLYRQMLRESKKFDSYSYREYALRKTRECFRKNITETNRQRIDELIEEAHKNLQIIRRQSFIGSLYPSKKLVIEESTNPLDNYDANQKG